MNWGSAVCDLLRGLLLTNEKLATFWGWMFGDDCKLTPEFGAELIEMLAPIGSGFWAPVDLVGIDEEVWVKCNGQFLLKAGTYAKLYTALGNPPDKPGDDTRFVVPNLSGRMLMVEGQREKGDGSADPPIKASPVFSTGDQGGVETVELTIANIGPHKHGTAAIRSGTGDPSQLFPLDNKEDPADSEKVIPIGYEVVPYKALEQTAGIPGNVFAPDDYANLTTVHYYTTEPIAEFSEDEDGKPITGDSVTTMSPHHVGVYYMRANYKINGKLIP